MFLPTEQRTPTRSSDGSSRQEFPVNYPSAYYQSGNYKDYLSRAVKYDKLALDLHENFLRFMPGSAPLLDFGCGVGFLVKSLQNLKYFTYGYDPSPWPVEHGSSVLGIEHLTTDYNKAIGPWEWYEAVTALDVFEHMKPDDVRHFLRNVKTRYLIVRIPVCLRDGEDFFLQVSRNDPTHITCMTKIAWETLFAECRFYSVSQLHLPTIYDTPGVLCAIYHQDK